MKWMKQNGETYVNADDLTAWLRRESRKRSRSDRLTFIAIADAIEEAVEDNR